MGRRMDRTRAMQVGLMVLLLVCAVQVLWWMLDEAVYTQRLEERFLLAHAQAEERSGGGPVDLTSLRSELAEERASRLRRFAWEGGFFLVVLVVGMGVLSRSLRREGHFRRRQENFLAAVSHEFKSPLASLRLSAESLSLRDPPPERRAQLVRRILDDLRRVESMVINILDATKLGRVRVVLEPERLDLPSMVQGAVDQVDERAKAAGASLQVDLPLGLAVRADPRAVRSVLGNLLDNALKAVARREDGRVQVSARHADGLVTLSVVDNGVGFEPGEAERLFRKFYRPGDELRRTSQGSGLGLYLVRRWVELGGGRAWAHSDGPGSGARFEVSWPAAQEGAA